MALLMDGGSEPVGHKPATAEADLTPIEAKGLIAALDAAQAAVDRINAGLDRTHNLLEQSVAELRAANEFAVSLSRNNEDKASVDGEAVATRRALSVTWRRRCSDLLLPSTTWRIR